MSCLCGFLTPFKFNSANDSNFLFFYRTKESLTHTTQPDGYKKHKAFWYECGQTDTFNFNFFFFLLFVFFNNDRGI